MLFGIVLCAVSVSASASWGPHPRLILNASRLAVVKGYISSNAQASIYYTALLAQGAHVLSTSPLPRPPENASDILSASRAVLSRVYITSLLYRLTDNATYAARAVSELLSISSWLDWDLSKHALDTGELCHAAAVGLDWSYDYLAQPAHAAERAAIVAGIVDKGLSQFAAAYAAGNSGDRWWTEDPSNWAIVTNAGAGLAALAIEGEVGAPVWLPALLANATRGVLSSATAATEYGGGFRNDGAWWEGPIYSGYALRYFVPFASGLESAKSDGSLFTLPGVSAAPSYQIHAMDNAWQYFNWGDSETGQETLAMLLTIAERAGDGASAFSLRARLDARAPAISLNDIDSGSQEAMEFPHALVYFTPAGTPADRAALPRDVAFPYKREAMLRSSWTDPNATFVAFKACNCSHNHGDLDHGTFVVSAAGQRFISDLGADNYGLPSYFGDLRCA